MEMHMLTRRRCLSGNDFPKPGGLWVASTGTPAQHRSSSSRAADAEENDIVRTENISAGIIPLLERNTTSQTLLRGRAYFLQRLVKTLLSAEGYEGFESGVSVAHLENRLAAALTLGAKEEFKVYLSMYAKRLGAESSRLKIEELLRNLLQGVHEQGGGAGMVDPEAKSDELCGWKKEVLLREVVLILGELEHALEPFRPANQRQANTVIYSVSQSRMRGYWESRTKRKMMQRWWWMLEDDHGFCIAWRCGKSVDCN